MSSDQPKAGVSYPIVLGTSFLNDGSHHAAFSTLRLDFIPASCDRTSPGNLHIHPENKAATLSLPSLNSSTTNDSIEFQGKFDPSKDGLDCVAIFDATTETFRLELIHGGQATLRHMPGSKRDKDLAGTKKKLIPGSGATAEDNPAEETRDMNIKKGNVAVAVAPIAAPSIKTVAALKGRKPAAAVIKISKDKEEIIEDEFFHGALD